MPQMFDKFCEPVHGGQAGPLVKIRPVKASELTTGNVVSGRVVSLDSNGDLVPGLDSQFAMPLFVFRGTESPSVYNTGTENNVTHWVPVAGRGANAIVFVASGGFELQTTEYDTTINDSDYTPNTPLTATATGLVTKAVGTGTPAEWKQIVGVCSVHENAENWRDPFGTGQALPTASNPTPVGFNAHGKKVLTFWSVYLPYAKTLA